MLPLWIVLRSNSEAEDAPTQSDLDFIDDGDVNMEYDSEADEDDVAMEEEPFLAIEDDTRVSSLFAMNECCNHFGLLTNILFRTP